MESLDYSLRISPTSLRLTGFHLPLPSPLFHLLHFTPALALALCAWPTLWQ
ncbi:hypothetical protein BDZ94DRAFT_1315371 [Collybia nuda]|uniref:Uncharacterized protein n=1 Tax=Collybia nuda TaxID=64659 RepID=A0A9P5XST5_9AGAR|nr:hypothetical protein BDZ94DRAFT_1315371 [Collybia nuda]